ncbi:DUF4238 domain-containing protein [Bacillus halotolerans]|uniref:DUF4238 domain-containing protein n=2 Tax=Bacillaceae TaxID=186817 RepID=UPI002DBFDAE7|nr:DUF4238 domain-containing protein [Bacillus halotolerans]MEC1406880.1 DUF4238 domain-containing protein [Bacillus halotolerans]
MNRNPVRQHTIPKTYLKHFSENQETIYLYDLNKEEIRQQSIASVSIVKDFYTVVDVDEQEKLYDLEHFLAESIEPIYNPTIQHLEDNQFLINKEEFSYFIAAQYLRSPRIKKQILNEIYDAVINGKSGEIFKDEDIKIFRKEFIQDGNTLTLKEFLQQREENEGISIIAEIDDSCYGQYFVKIISKLAKAISEKNWGFINPPKKRNFITCDNSYIRADAYGGNIGWINGDIFILSKNLALVIGDIEGWYDINLNDVKLINTHAVLNADRYVFSHSSELLNRFVRKNKNKSKDH